MDVSNISSFEDNNPEVSVNVFILKKYKNEKTGKDKHIVCPFYSMKSRKKYHSNLLLIEEHYEYEEPTGDNVYYEYDEYAFNDEDEACMMREMLS